MFIFICNCISIDLLIHFGPYWITITHPRFSTTGTHVWFPPRSRMGSKCRGRHGFAVERRAPGDWDKLLATGRSENNDRSMIFWKKTTRLTVGFTNGDTLRCHETGAGTSTDKR